MVVLLASTVPTDPRPGNPLQRQSPGKVDEAGVTFVNGSSLSHFKRILAMEPGNCSIDLEAYFTRIGYSGQRQPTATALKEIHLAHATHIPFENLDVLAGHPIRLDLASLQAKL